VGGTDFSTFFEAEYERLLKTMAIIAGNRAEAEDIAQEAMPPRVRALGYGVGRPVASRVRVRDRLQRASERPTPGGSRAPLPPP
jgi:hypothetical protein